MVVLSPERNKPFRYKTILLFCPPDWGRGGQFAQSAQSAQSAQFAQSAIPLRP